MTDGPRDLTVREDEANWRAVRGADYASPPRYARSAYRNGFEPNRATNTGVGFRVARTVRD